MTPLPNIESSKILIIDDDEIMRIVLREILEKFGFSNITEAKNGKEGWDKTVELSPDIVFLDMNMPIMNGFEYCIKVRSHPDFAKTAILVQSGLTDIEEKKKIFAVGATDYVSKPIDANEIIARTIVHLKNSHYLKELKEFNDRVKLELQSAKRLVNISLPSAVSLKNIRDSNKISIFSHFQSSSEMGGDFWGLHKIDDNKTAVYIVDFSGHGVDSALNATRLDCLVKSASDKSHDPAMLMHWLNNNLYDLLPPEQYATMFYGVINTVDNTMCYSAAACPEIFILRNGSIVEMLDGSGFPLGSSNQAVYQNQTIPFASEDIMLLYSDGVIETADQNGQFLPSVSASFLKCYNKERPDLLQQYFDSFIANFLNDYGKNLTDDLTIILLSRVV